MSSAVALEHAAGARDGGGAAKGANHRWLRALELTARFGERPWRTLPVVIDELAERFGDAPALLSERERFSFGSHVVVEEHVLVPRPGSGREGEGWLVGMGYDVQRRRSFLSVFDALRLADGPVARAWLPYWVPYGFHGRFQAA